MKKINRERSPKGSVTVRKKGNSYEARVTLELVSVVEGVERNPRLSRTAKTEADARKRLGNYIAEIYFEMQKKSNSKKVFTDECNRELDKFEEYKEEQRKKKIETLADEYTLFPNIAKEWLNYKKKQVNPNTNKTISPKTIETYINTIKNHVMIDFKDYHISDISKEMIEEYINKKRQNTPRLAKDLFLLIRAVLTYAMEEKNLISDVPNFNLKFPKKKRTKKAQIPYLPKDRQAVWLDILEEDKRGFALLFATLLQTGMRPEERMWTKMEKRYFRKEYHKSRKCL